MFSHVMIGSNDLEHSKRFYDALFGAIGGEPGTVDQQRGRLVYSHNGGRFLVTKPINGEPATGANGGTIGFSVESADQAAAWHKAVVENGGIAIEDPPGERGSGNLYIAYLRDPDGNKLCALHRKAA